MSIQKVSWEYIKDTEKIPTSYQVTEDRKSIWFHLPLEDHYFFSLDREKQVDLLTDFVKKSFSEAKRMKIKSGYQNTIKHPK